MRHLSCNKRKTSAAFKSSVRRVKIVGISSAHRGRPQAPSIGRNGSENPVMASAVIGIRIPSEGDQLSKTRWSLLLACQWILRIKCHRITYPPKWQLTVNSNSKRSNYYLREATSSRWARCSLLNRRQTKVSILALLLRRRAFTTLISLAGSRALRS